MKYVIGIREMCTSEEGDFQTTKSIRQREKIEEKILLSLSNTYLITPINFEKNRSVTGKGRIIEFRTEHAGLLLAVDIVKEARKDISQPELIKLFIAEDQIL